MLTFTYVLAHCKQVGRQSALNATSIHFLLKKSGMARGSVRVYRPDNWLDVSSNFGNPHGDLHGAGGSAKLLIPFPSDQ